MAYILETVTDPKEEDIVLARVLGREDAPTGRYIVARQTKGSLSKLAAKNPKPIEARPGESFVPALSKTGIKRVFVAGPTGSGKSVVTGQMLSQSPYPVVIVSRLSEDPSLDDRIENQIRIPMESIVDEPLDVTDIADHVLLADDIDSHRDKKIVKLWQQFIDDSMEVGRHSGVKFLIRTSHHTFNGRPTRQSLLECNCVIGFPHSGGSFHLKRMLRDHVGLSQAKTSALLKTPSRWVAIYRDTPNALITQHHVELLT